MRVRPGFTLVEVLLVLAVLVLVAAMAAPRLGAGVEQSRLDRAAEELRTAWGKARLLAASQGQTYRFQCRVGSGWASIAPAASFPGELDGQSDGDLNEDSEENPTSTSDDSSEQELSKVVFRQLLVAQQPGDPAIGAGVVDGELSAAILFRPDGTTSDAEAILETKGGLRIRVMLRGLTGSSTVEDVVGAAYE